MRNLKKVLSLVLCLAMVLSIMVMGTGAVFTDQGDIQYDEAVNMCVALNIIQGYTDNSFQPTKDVTRAEMCKMIAVALNGGEKPKGLAEDDTSSSFPDVVGTWGAPYIEYCRGRGIVQGDPNGKFRPNATVKGVEAAKMLLVALGLDKMYGPEITGADWKVQTNYYAGENGLYDELINFDSSQLLNRDEAAQMIWNTLNANMCKHVSTSTGNGNTYTQEDQPTMLQDKYKNTSTTVGYLTGIKYVEEEGYTYTINEDVPAVAAGASARDAESDPGTPDPGTTTPSTGTPKWPVTAKTDADYTALFMQNVKVIKEMKKGEEVVLGIFAEDSKVLASGVIGDIDTDNAKKEQIKIGDDAYKLNGQFSKLAAYPFTVSDTAGDEASGAVYTSAEDYYSFDLIDKDGDGKGDYLVSYPVYITDVTNVSTKGINFTSITVPGEEKAITSFTYENDSIVSGLEKGDWIVITAKTNEPTYTNTVVKAEVVTGEISGKKADSVQVDGTWYSVDSAVKMADLKNGESYDFVVYNGYIFSAEATEEAGSDILFVSAIADVSQEFEQEKATVDARVYFTDGSNDKVTVSKVGGKDVSKKTDIKPDENTLYTYKVVDGKYELTKIEDKITGYDNFDSKTSGAYANEEFVGDNGSYAFADDAVVFVVSKDTSSGAADDATKVSVMSGKDVAAWGELKDGVKFSPAGVTLTVKTNGIEYVKVATLIDKANETPDATSDVQYGYIVADVYSSKKGDNEAYLLQVWNGSKDVELYAKVDVEANNGLATAKAGTPIAYTVSGDFITVENIGLTPVAITGFSGKTEGTLIYATKDTKTAKVTLDKDCVILGIDSAAKKGAPCDITKIVTCNTDNGDKVFYNAYLVLGTKDKASTVLAIVYDIGNQLDGEASFEAGAGA